MFLNLNERYDQVNSEIFVLEIALDIENVIQNQLIQEHKLLESGVQIESVGDNLDISRNVFIHDADVDDFRNNIIKSVENLKDIEGKEELLEKLEHIKSMLPNIKFFGPKTKVGDGVDKIFQYTILVWLVSSLLNFTLGSFLPMFVVRIIKFLTNPRFLKITFLMDLVGLLYTYFSRTSRDYRKRVDKFNDFMDITIDFVKNNNKKEYKKMLKQVK